jgi:hypothetical protein
LYHLKRIVLVSSAFAIPPEPWNWAVLVPAFYIRLIPHWFKNSKLLGYVAVDAQAKTRRRARIVQNRPF